MTCDDTRCLPPTEVDFKFDSGTGAILPVLMNPESQKKITDQSKVQNASDDQLSSDINAAGTGRGQQKYRCRKVVTL